MKGLVIASQKGRRMKKDRGARKLKDGIVYFAKYVGSSINGKEIIVRFKLIPTKGVKYENGK